MSMVLSLRHIHRCYIQTITMNSRLLIFYRERACFYTECYFKINETFAFFSLQYNTICIIIFAFSKYAPVISS